MPRSPQTASCTTMKGVVSRDHTQCFRNNIYGRMSPCVHPRQESGVTSGEGQYERGTCSNQEPVLESLSDVIKMYSQCSHGHTRFSHATLFDSTVLSISQRLIVLNHVNVEYMVVVFFVVTYSSVCVCGRGGGGVNVHILYIFINITNVCLKC